MDLNSKVSRAIEHYLNLDSIDIKPQLTPSELCTKLALQIPESPETPERIDQFIDHYLSYSVNTNSKKFANQLWSKTDTPSILGEVLSAVTNTSMYTYEVAPVATLLEQKMVAYLSELIWGAQTDGIMTSGGSSSNLQALLVARNTKISETKKWGIRHADKTPVVLAAKNAHYSIKRAVNILGIGHQNLVEIETRPGGQLCTFDLKEKINILKLENRVPFCLVSTAGTTVEGSYDSLPEVASICHEHDIWLHVDGAYGGSVLLSSKHVHLLDGINQADSFSWDFHKVLGINLPCAFLFLKQEGLLRGSLDSGNDAYLFHNKNDSCDLGPKSIQCGRKNDILKLWLTWQSLGRIGLENKINRLFDLAQEFADLVDLRSELTLLNRPQSINICFRYNLKKGLDEKIRNQLLKNGEMMLNYSKDNDGPYFRLAITRPDLTTSDLNILLDKIIKVGNELS